MTKKKEKKEKKEKKRKKKKKKKKKKRISVPPTPFFVACCAYLVLEFQAGIPGFEVWMDLGQRSESAGQTGSL